MEVCTIYVNMYYIAIWNYAPKNRIIYHPSRMTPLLPIFRRSTLFQQGGGDTVRQAVGEVQSLELHQIKSAMVLSTILIKNKVILHYKMVFDEILNHNVYLFVLTLT